MYEYAATVRSVHDGDTFEADLDLGFHTHLRTSIRLAGINAPELGKVKALNPDGQAATEGLMGLLGGRDLFAAVRTRPSFGIPGDYLLAPGVRIDLVVVTIALREFEKYGRVLASARLLGAAGTATTINDAMVASGWAAVYA